MCDYVCPQCGSQYLRVKEGGSSSVFTVGSEYAITIVQSAESSSSIGKNASIHCAACSWRGQVVDLQETDHLL